MDRIYATCVEIDGTGVLLRGPSGRGKSDLALRLIDGGARLVADDYTELEVRGGKLLAYAPSAIAGLLEVRGLGVLRMDRCPEVGLGLAIELVRETEMERLPEPEAYRYLGVSLPLFKLNPFEVSAVPKVRLALQIAKGTIMRIP
jgi:serine kinase of HPr protein (carbohydrate metabolism regulator)